MPEDLWVAVCSKLDTDGDGMLQVGEFMKEMKNAVADTSVGLALSTCFSFLCQVCLSVCLSACLSVCLSVCLPPSLLSLAVLTTRCGD